jgi:hypothetical protein
MESAGLKEWATVCEAMGRGEQSVILRKGGLAEGRTGFGFRHSEFFLFPTFFHEQIDKVRISGAEIPKAREGEIEIRFLARLIAATHITSWKTAAALEPLHILQQSVVRERFDYDRAPGLHVALVRVFRLAPSWILPDAPRYAGCRSWVTLPEYSPETRFEPVLTDKEHDRRVKAFHDFTRFAEMTPLL